MEMRILEQAREKGARAKAFLRTVHKPFWKLLKAWKGPIVAAILTVGLLKQVHSGSSFDASNIGWVVKSGFHAISVLWVLLFSTVSMVGLTLFAFGISVLGWGRNIQSPGGRRWATVAQGITFLSVILCVMWFVSIYSLSATNGILGFCPGWVSRHFDVQRYFHETFSIVLFSSFLAIDLLMHRAGTIELAIVKGKVDELQCLAGELDASDCQELGERARTVVARNYTEEERRLKFIRNTIETSRDSIWFVDVPVLCGLLIVLALCHHIHKDEFLSGTWTANLTQDQARLAVEVFLQGLSVGAIAMHMIFSQMIFGMLNTRDKFRET
jgi:hypothetical protein